MFSTTSKTRSRNLDIGLDNNGTRGQCFDTDTVRPASSTVKCTDKSSTVRKNVRFSSTSRQPEAVEPRSVATDDNVDTRTCDQNDDEEDFSQYVRKRVRRYHISGFKSNMTQDLITRYVERRNVTVTWVTIFQLKTVTKLPFV